MPAGLGFIVQAILGMMGSQSLLHVGALSVRLSEGFLVLMAVCSVRSSCVLYLVVVSMVVLSQAILCPVVRYDENASCNVTLCTNHNADVITFNIYMDKVTCIDTCPQPRTRTLTTCAYRIVNTE